MRRLSLGREQGQISRCSNISSNNLQISAGLLARADLFALSSSLVT